MSQDAFNMYDEFESWEDDYKLLNSQQYDKLVELREKVVLAHPDDIQSVLDLCDAYCLNSEYQKSLDLLQGIYRENNDIEAIQYLILDSLRGLSRSYEDFDWVQQPVVFRLDEKTCTTCFDLVKGKRRGMSAIYLELELYNLGYMEFKTDELVEFLSEDSRFQVTTDGHPMTAIIKKKAKR
jgi:hypothetical protein